MELKILRTNLSQRYDFKETKEMIKFQKVTPVKTQAYFWNALITLRMFISRGTKNVLRLIKRQQVKRNDPNYPAVEPIRRGENHGSVDRG